MATARLVEAVEMEPKDMALAAKRLTISCRFNLFQRNWSGCSFEMKEPAQGFEALTLVINQPRILCRLQTLRSRTALKFCDAVRRPHVVFTTGAVFIAPGV